MTWGFKLMRRPHPDNEAYAPRMIRGDGPDEPVPEKFKNVRLKRRRIARLAPTPLIIRLVIVAAIIGFVLVILKVCSVRTRVYGASTPLRIVNALDVQRDGVCGPGA